MHWMGEVKNVKVGRTKPFWGKGLFVWYLALHLPHASALSLSLLECLTLPHVKTEEESSWKHSKLTWDFPPRKLYTYEGPSQNQTHYSPTCIWPSGSVTEVPHETVLVRKKAGNTSHSRAKHCYVFPEFREEKGPEWFLRRSGDCTSAFSLPGSLSLPSSCSHLSGGKRSQKQKDLLWWWSGWPSRTTGWFPRRKEWCVLFATKVQGSINFTFFSG